MKTITDCHVNIWNPGQLTALWRGPMARMRPDATPGVLADADTLFEAMAGVCKAIVFPIRYGDSAGVESDDETCVRHDLPLTMHMGTTFARNAPIELGRAIHVEPVALRYPDLKLICAHMGHPWYEETIAVVRKQPNVVCEISALFYRPWQFWNILACAQEYRMTDKIFFGTDFPFSGVQESIDGLKNVNRVVEGTGLPRIAADVIDGILHSSPFEHWWHRTLRFPS